MPFPFAFGIVELGLVILVVVAAFVLVGRRARPDLTGRRAMAIYLLVVMFIMLFTAAAAVARMGATLAENVVDLEPGIPRAATPFGPPPGPRVIEERPPLPPEAELTPVDEYRAADRMGADLLEAGLAGLLAAAIFQFHRRRWNDLLRKETGND
jgi:hypothetical protein